MRVPINNVEIIEVLLYNFYAIYILYMAIFAGTEDSEVEGRNHLTLDIGDEETFTPENRDHEILAYETAEEEEETLVQETIGEEEILTLETTEKEEETLAHETAEEEETLAKETIEEEEEILALETT